MARVGVDGLMISPQGKGHARSERHARWQAIAAANLDLRLGPRYLAGIGEAAVVVPTQAWFLHERNRPLHELRAAGTPFYALTRAYLDCAPGPVVGVSGSHGKSTTAALVAALLRVAGDSPSATVRLAGNDRHDVPCLVEVAGGDARDALVLEVSNRQLLQMDRAPEIACLTNVTANHLEEHGGLGGYIEAKRRLFALPGNRVAVRNGDDPLSLARCAPAKGAREWRFAIGPDGLGPCDGVHEADGGLVVRRDGAPAERLPLASTGLIGAHNRANMRAAVAVVASMGPIPS
ncbi:MAG: Mur ligase family protein, partial [Solirubrobacteraceae bacterium]